MWSSGDNPWQAVLMRTATIPLVCSWNRQRCEIDRRLKNTPLYDHVVVELLLVSLPEKGERFEPEPLADVLDATFLVAGENGAGADRPDVRVVLYDVLQQQEQVLDLVVVVELVVHRLADRGAVYGAAIHRQLHAFGQRWDDIVPDGLEAVAVHLVDALVRRVQIRQADDLVTVPDRLDHGENRILAAGYQSGHLHG